MKSDNPDQFFFDQEKIFQETMQNGLGILVRKL